MARVIDFRVHVDKVHAWLESVDGRVASQVFTPHTVGDDGVTTGWIRWRLRYQSHPNPRAMVPSMVAAKAT
jgi:hypothetical protein